MKPQNITLTETEKDDLNALFEFQLDEEANFLAAFSSKDPNDKTAYIEKYAKFLSDPTITMRTIRADNQIVGSVSKFILENDAEITYWIDRRFWGNGIATAALNDFLKIEQIRPIYGRIAFDNYVSQKVLEKCGFVKIGNEMVLLMLGRQTLRNIFMNFQTTLIIATEEGRSGHTWLV